MSDDYTYTPTTEQMRDDYALDDHGYRDWSTEMSYAEFDRWLAFVRREAQAEIVQEAEAIRTAFIEFWGAHSYNDLVAVGRDPKMPRTPALNRAAADIRTTESKEN